MMIPTDIGLWLQKQLIGLYHEDWGLVYTTSGNLGSIPFCTSERWQLGVDLTYRGLLCDLIKVDDFGAASDRTSFLNAIRSLDPWGDGGGFWHATVVSGAPRLNELIEAHFPPPDQRDGKLNPTFIEALEQIFADNGVPWSNKPLLPIRPANAEAHAPR